MKKYLVFAFTLILSSACIASQQQKNVDAKDDVSTETVLMHPNANKQAHRWNLADLYPDDSAWAKSQGALELKLAGLTEYRGRLTENAQTLAEALEARTVIKIELRRLSSYAGKRSDEDMRNAHALEMKQSMSALATRFGQSVSYFEPEIIATGAQVINAFVKDEKRLKPYDRYLADTLRSAPHTLDAKGEKILAASGLISDAPSTFYSILANAEIPWPTITLSNGEVVRLDQAAYSKYRVSNIRADRIKVFEAFWSTFRKYEKTLGVALYAQMKKDYFYAQVRDYDGTLERALDANYVPVAVYKTLIETTNANLDTLHRYFQLRGRMLGIDDMHYHDIYSPLVATELEFPIEKGKDLVLKALAPMGENYVSTVEQGFRDRWMDTYPRPGKSSGAYSSGSAYEVHPFILMNYTDDFESVSTMAHEWGHTMHSYLANQTQPYPKVGYSIFIAEVASTFNEALLLDYVLKNVQNDEEKLYYLGSALEGLRGTFYRQAMFAEFELKIHELVEQGEALSGDRFTRIYADIVRRYHGQDKGILTVDDLYTIEWAFIPHFYYNYYVYQYATAIAATSLLAEEALGGKENAIERFLSVLKAGNSEYPYELLKNAGVDLATPAPYEALVARMNRIMDEIEVILEKRG